MSTVIFGAIGAAIGAVADPLAPWQGAMWGWSIGTVVGGLLFPPNMPAMTLGKLDDLRVSSSSYGTFIPQIWGYYRVAGQYIWSTPLQQSTQTGDTSGGGSGGGSGPTIYTYSASFAVLICRGPVKSIGRIWMNDMIVYDPGTTINQEVNTYIVSGAGNSSVNGTYTLKGGFGLNNYFNGVHEILQTSVTTSGVVSTKWIIGTYFTTGHGGGGYYQISYINPSTSSSLPLTGWEVATGATVNSYDSTSPAPSIAIGTYINTTSTTSASVNIEGIYLGTEDQEPDTFMAASLSASDNPCPAYRGYCYIVFSDVDLTNYGNRLPNIQIEVIGYGDTVAEVLQDVYTQGSLTPPSLIVSGAGTSAVNGTYVPTTMNIINGQSIYTNENGYNIQCNVDTNEWEIIQIIGTATYNYYSNTSTNSVIIPPLTGWVDVSIGASPAPSIISVPNDFDVSTAIQGIIGYCNPTRQIAKAAIEPLQQQVFADIVEADGLLKWIARGGAPCRTFTSDNMGAQLWDGQELQDDTVLIAYKKQQAWELPTIVQVNYYQWNSDLEICNYLQAMQMAIRTTTNTQQNILSLTLPSVMDDTTARQIAEYILYTAWIEADSYTTNVGIRDVDLMVSDIVLAPQGGQNRRMRIISDSMAIPGLQQLSLVADQVMTLYQYIEAGVTGGIGADNLTNAGQPISWLAFQCNAPTQSAAIDGYVHVYLAANWIAGGNNYCTIYVSIDNGITFVLVTTLSVSTTMGQCTNILGDWSDPSTMDTTNTLDVTIQTGEFISCSSADLANGTNALWVNGELIQFQTATLIGTGNYSLSNLMRGQRGTYSYMSGHIVNEQVVMMNDNIGIYKTQPNPYGTGPTLGSTLIFKFIFSGNSNPQTQQLILEALEWLCYPVIPVSGSRSNIVIG